MSWKGLIEDELRCKKLLDTKEFKSIYIPYQVQIVHDICVNEKCWYLRSFVDQKSIRYKLTTGTPPLSVLGNECCAENRFYKTAQEAIVSIESINLSPSIRGKKNMKKFLFSGDQIYRSHGYKTMILSAIRDGMVAWHRMGFEYYSPTDKMKVFNEFRRYYQEMNDVECPYKSLRDAKTKDFFHTDKTFTQWLEERNYYGIRMIRRIPDAS